MKLKVILFVLIVSLGVNSNVIFGGQGQAKKRGSTARTQKKAIPAQRGRQRQPQSVQQKKAMQRKAALPAAAARRQAPQQQLFVQKVDKDFGGIINNYLFFWQVPAAILSGKSNEINQTCFSQWYPSELRVYNITFYNTEQFMMYCKARCFGDLDSAIAILETKDPEEIKKLGRGITSFNAQAWSRLAPYFVELGNVEKFRQNPLLKKYLMSTNNMILAEASPYDKIWGIGLRSTDAGATNKAQWQGQNLLGQTLMTVRERLKRSDNPYGNLLAKCQQFTGLIEYVNSNGLN